MAESDVTAVFGPPYIRRYVELLEWEVDRGEKIIASLRTKLREHDPSLPHEYDASAWAKIERIEHPSRPRTDHG